MRTYLNTGYDMLGDLARPNLAALIVPLILNLGPPIRVFEAGAHSSFSRFAGGFVAGLDDRFTFTEHDGGTRAADARLRPAQLLGYRKEDRQRDIGPSRMIDTDESGVCDNAQ